MIESVCDPTKDEGAWLKFLDMVETDAQRIKVERQPEDGPCGSECKTLALACQQLLEEGWENELGEALFSSTSADELVESACKEWSSACRKAPPKVDKARKPGPSFRPCTEDERALETYESGKPNAPGVFGDEQQVLARDRARGRRERPRRPRGGQHGHAAEARRLRSRRRARARPDEANVQSSAACRRVCADLGRVSLPY